jgi:hypothetical protein
MSPEQVEEIVSILAKEETLEGHKKPAGVPEKTK